MTLTSMSEQGLMNSACLRESQIDIRKLLPAFKLNYTCYIPQVPRALGVIKNVSFGPVEQETASLRKGTCSWRTSVKVLTEDIFSRVHMSARQVLRETSAMLCGSHPDHTMNNVMNTLPSDTF